MESLSFSGLFILWLAGLLAGFVDSIAGGGGIISLPALLASGMPPHLALGTNKLQGTFGSLTSALNYTKAEVRLPKVPWSLLVPKARWGGIPLASSAGREMIPPPPAILSTNPASKPASHNINSADKDRVSICTPQ